MTSNSRDRRTEGDSTRLELDFPIRSYETGADGALRLASVADYLQEAAGHHARVLGVSMDRLFEHDLAWVLRRLRVEVGPLPPRGSVVRIATWPTRFDRLVAERHFLGSQESQGSEVRSEEPFLKAVSEWVIVNLTSRRVVRIPEFVRDLRPRSLEQAASLSKTRNARGRAPSQDSGATGVLLSESTFRARRSSLDIVGHVNNTQYIEWIIDSLPSPLLEVARVSVFEIQFLKETRLGELVRVETTSGEEASRGGPQEGQRTSGSPPVRRLVHRVLARGESEADSVATLRAVAHSEWLTAEDRTETASGIR